VRGVALNPEKDFDQLTQSFGRIASELGNVVGLAE
jgi:hypothetical protein